MTSALMYGYLWAGRKLLNLLKASLADRFFVSLVAGIIVVEALSMIPYVGWIARVVPFLLGVSAMWQVIRTGLKNEKAEAQAES